MYVGGGEAFRELVGEREKSLKGKKWSMGCFFFCVEETLGGPKEVGLVTITTTMVTIDSTMVIRTT